MEQCQRESNGTRTKNRGMVPEPGTRTVPEPRTRTVTEPRTKTVRETRTVPELGTLLSAPGYTCM